MRRSAACAVAGLALACASRSPFVRSPAQLAMEEPCRYLGTFHKESRVRLEELRMCNAIDDAEWGCMAKALRALDLEYTAECRERKVRYRELADLQRGRYAECLDGDAAIAGCAVLSEDGSCLTEQCR